MSIESEIADLTQATTDLLGAVQISKTSLDEAVAETYAAATAFATAAQGGKADTAVQGSTGATDNAILRADGIGGGTVQAGTNAPTYTDDGMLSVAPAGLTGSAATSALEITQAWNTTGNPTAVKVNVSNTVSGASANLLDLQVGAASKFLVTKYGDLTLAGQCISLGNTFKMPDNGGNGVWNTTVLSIQTAAALQWADASQNASGTCDLFIRRDAAATLAQRNSTNAQESRLYATWTSATNYQRLATKTLKQAITVASGATAVTTITIPKYSHLIGVTTRVTTELTAGGGVTGYSVGDGTDPDLWGAITGTAVGTTTDAANYTAVDALGPDGADRTITLTATGANFAGGVIEVCAYYLRAEAD